MPNLFSEFNLKGKRIKNRIVMPPMVCFNWSGSDGIITDKHIEHYERRAKGGTGLIILEAHCVNKHGKLADSQLGIWSDEHIEGLSKIAEACHKYGSVVLVQIHHAGIDITGATTLQLENIQQNFVDAAIRAEKAGVDGIELHGAHGYLISQTMSPIKNKRDDKYGGSVEKRTVFAVEIIQKIKNVVSPSFIIGYRMGGNEPTLENGIIIAKELEKCGIDLLHVSWGISSQDSTTAPKGFGYSDPVYFGTEIKKNVELPIIVVNGIRSSDQAKALIESGMADFVAIGKGILANPDWAENARTGVYDKQCRNCKRCSWFSSPEKCPEN